MKRIVGTISLIIIFIGMTIATIVVCKDKIITFATQENQEKTALVQQRLDDTLALLDTLSRNPYICDKKVSYTQKAEYLTEINVNGNLGYMMVRILDSDINIYKEGVGLASNLGSREYMQKLYATGEQQVTDAFLAGADGETINYTVTVAIQEDGQVVGALMAAIYGTEMDAYLQDEDSINVLVGSQLQYMGGITDERFGLAVAQVLDAEQSTSRPMENILLDFKNQEGGEFWGIGDGVRYFAYAPIDHCEWIVLTEVSVLPMVQNILLLYGASVVVLIIIYVVMFRRKKY